MINIYNIVSNLLAGLEPTVLIVNDDSASHADHYIIHDNMTGEVLPSHLQIKIESKHFKDMSLVQRHRAVYSLMQPLFDRGLHALQIDAKYSE